MDLYESGFEDELFPESDDKYSQQSDINSFLDLKVEPSSDDQIFFAQNNFNVKNNQIYENEKLEQSPDCISNEIRQPNSEDQNFFSEGSDIDNFTYIESGKRLQSQEAISDSSSKGPPIKQETPEYIPKEEVQDPLIMDRIPQQRIAGLPANISTHENQSLRKTNGPKLRIDFSESQSSFKQQFYSIFLNDIKGKNIFPKDKVIVIHNSICVQAGVRRMKRDEYRAINNYFKHFAKYKNQILFSLYF